MAENKEETKKSKKAELTILLADTALELIPNKYINHPSVKNNIQKLGKAGRILDTALHQSLITKLPKAEKRGRPDILHHFLLDTLGSPANKKGKLNIIFECQEGVFKVDSHMRCPRDYLRFKGLMTQLLREGRVPPKRMGKALINKIEPDFRTWWIKYQKNWKRENIFKCLEPKLAENNENNSIKLFSEICQKNEKILCIIGGFQKGNISEQYLNLQTNNLSFRGGAFDSWIIVQRVLSIFEQENNFW